MILLVTGASGGVGRGIVRLLAGCDKVEKIYALGRRNRVEFSSPKIEFIAADVTEEIPVPDKIRLSVTAILHGAAETRFSAPLDLARRVNVDGLANIVTFASRCPRLDRFGFLSTVYVSGRNTGRIRETDLTNTAGFVNAYEQSKFEAEQFLRRQVTHLPVMIYRLSTIFGDAKTGEVTKIGAIHQALRFFYHSLAPMIPGTADTPVDLIASDYAIGAVSHLFRERLEPGKTFHVCAANDAMLLGELLNTARDCFLRCRPEWRKRAIEMPMTVGLKTFETFVRTVEETGNLALQQSVKAIKYFAPQLAFPKTFDDTECASALAGTNVERPVLRDFFPRIVEYLVNEKWSAASEHRTI
jgi:nucleoside-diphosphate-sugar epimerase